MRNLFFLLAALFAFSCNNEKEKADEKTVEPVQIDRHYWQSTLDSAGELKMVKVPANDSPDVNAILAFINKEHPNIQLELVRSSNDTIYLQIPDATYLTQQMGSTGPAMYLSKLVYNFTELPGIKEVNLDFEEGDHASPGTFNRSTFNQQ